MLPTQSSQSIKSETTWARAETILLTLTPFQGIVSFPATIGPIASIALHAQPKGFRIRNAAGVRRILQHERKEIGSHEVSLKERLDMIRVRLYHELCIGYILDSGRYRELRRHFLDIP